MLVLGIILVLLAGGAFVAALAGGSHQPAAFDLGLVEIQTNTLGVFLFGAVTVLLLAIGVWLTRAGIGQARRRHKDKKELIRLTTELEARDSRAETGEQPSEQTSAATGEQPREKPAEPPAEPTPTRTDGPVTEQDRDAP